MSGGDNIATKVINEEFRSFDQLLHTLDKRKNNSIMSGEHSSRTGSREFTGTRDYAEAVKLLRSGYNEAAKMLRTDVKQKDKINSKYQQMQAHPIPHTAIVGFVPNVPNAIRNLPNSMISVDRKPQKRKTLRILYSMHGNCGMTQEYFSKAGAALLSAVNLIEKSGIQTKIDLAFMTSSSGEELCFPTICIKNFGERYSFQKVSFPMVHPSMFRRIGFKWLETTPDITSHSFCHGYGHSPSNSEVSDAVGKRKDTYYIDTEWINNHDCSVEEVLKYFEVI